MEFDILSQIHSKVMRVYFFRFSNILERSINFFSKEENSINEFKKAHFE